MKLLKFIDFCSIVLKITLLFKIERGTASPHGFFNWGGFPLCPNTTTPLAIMAGFHFCGTVHTLSTCHGWIHGRLHGGGARLGGSPPPGKSPHFLAMWGGGRAFLLPFLYVGAFSCVFLHIGAVFTCRGPFVTFFSIW